MDLLRQPAHELRRRIGEGVLTATQLAGETLKRIELCNPGINAICNLSDRLLDDARELDRKAESGEELGALHGVPVGIKDVTEVAGMVTTYGSPLYRENVPEHDALIVQRFREAGALIVGKTNTPEFAAGGNTFNEVYGRTRNPWDPSRSAGGSTGGGAAGLATGMIALAEGTDLGGSLRIPASFCGVVGIRPSPGLVPTHPTHYLWDRIQVTGPMARTAEDLAMVLDAVAGPSPLSPIRQPALGRDFAGAMAEGVREDLRIAYSPDPVGIGIDPDVERVCRDALEAMARDGIRVEQVDLDLSVGREAFLALRGHWMVVHHRVHLDRQDRLGANVSGNIKRGLATSTEQLAAAEQDRATVWGKLAKLFERFDHLITPTMAVPPFPVEDNYPRTVAGQEMETYIDWVAPTFVLSLTELPVASVPAGLASSGLPVGLQVVGKPAAEEDVLALSAVIERTSPIGFPPLEPLQ